jgi:ribosomal protein L40E
MSDNFIGFFLVVAVMVVMIAIRVYAGSLDRERIRENVESHGGKVIDIAWAPLGARWRTGRNARLYDVRYRTHHGTVLTARCTTSMLSGVWWFREAPPGFATEASLEAGSAGEPSASPEATNRSLAAPAEPVTCLSCGARMKARDTRCAKCGWSYQGT